MSVRIRFAPSPGSTRAQTVYEGPLLSMGLAANHPEQATSEARSASKGKLQRWSVYIAQCADGSFYIGSAIDVMSRIARHNAGRGAMFTAEQRPIRLVYSEPYMSEAAARQRETQLKKWSRAKKAALIAGCNERLRILSRSHD